ncbi:Lecithin:cholesterol acyltransferase [Thiorhodococcus drewsii AZ1]|uniref:Lecithin:cholesterol acyltransferase n=1 Tax=Thiorhodococcus drewsii AZ1 TaxID=765913 RepID=G2E3Q3_9GAMM|nr:DUF4214 domain-containing protein [Thiorhodococcus drewsii]EGV30166.1 Lecithin:cholesterol acyltransferase [Thiorhodococcus drewsii AZ1]
MTVRFLGSTLSTSNDNPPVVTINTPGGGSNNPKTNGFSLEVTVTDDIGLVAATYDVQTSSGSSTGQKGSADLTGTGATAIFAIDLDSLESGSYKIEVGATDTSHQQADQQYYWFQKSEISETWGIPSTERQALIALYNATNGPQWKDHTGWLGAVGTECTWPVWYGILCSRDSTGQVHVASLELPDNRLSGSLPTELEQLTELRYINLENNKLTGSFPLSLLNLNQLARIKFGHNQFNGTIPEALGNLDLITLDLRNNQFSGAIPATLGNMGQLGRLELGNNQLSGDIPKELGDLDQIQWLAIENNQLTGSIPRELGGLDHLKGLKLNLNQLSGALPPELGDLGKLTYLGLDDNQLSGAIPSELGNLDQLGWLELGNNQLTGTIPEELGNLGQLIWLNLGGNQLSGAIPPELANLGKIEGLTVYNNQLSGPIPAALGNLETLTYLSLESNKFSGDVPGEIGQLSNLTELYLNNNNITGIAKGLAQLNTLSVLKVADNCLKASTLDSAVVSFLDANDPGWENSQKTTCGIPEPGPGNKPVVSQVSIGATGSLFGGSFMITDSDGDEVKNLRVFFSDGKGNVCHTDYLKAGYEVPVETGLINFSTRDCVTLLDSSSDITWEVEAYDTQGLHADPVQGKVVRTSSNHVPVGATVRWDSVPDELQVGVSYTLELSLVDSSGVIVSGFSGPAAMWATGIDIETLGGLDAGGRRLVWFDGGQAYITGFRAITEGLGALSVQVPVVFDSQMTATAEGSRALGVDSKLTSGVGSLDSQHPISSILYGNCEEAYLNTIVRVPLTQKGIPITGTLQYRLSETSPWVSMEKKKYFYSIATREEWNSRTPILQLGKSIDIRYKLDESWITAGYTDNSSEYQYRYTHTACDHGNTSYTVPSKGLFAKPVFVNQGRPVLLVHGIFGSTLGARSARYPRMPKQICQKAQGGRDAAFNDPDCDNLEFFTTWGPQVPVFGMDPTGWTDLESDLIARGFVVYRVAWDWRATLHDNVYNYLIPAIDNALNDAKNRNSRYEKVDIIAHSMGGLLTRYLIQLSGQLQANQIDRFIMIGTPNGGSVKTYYFLSAADPLSLDISTEELGLAGRVIAPLFYSSTANNLFIAAFGSALLRDSRNNLDDEANIDEGGGVYGYTDKWRGDTRLRRRAIRALAPGGNALLPLSNAKIFGPLRYGHTTEENYELERLYAVRDRNLICNPLSADGLKNPLSPDKIETWLILTDKPQAHMPRYAFVYNPACQSSTCSDDIDNYWPQTDSSTNNFVFESANGDGTVPTDLAKMGLEALDSAGNDCILEIGNNDHGTQPDDPVIQEKIFEILQAGRASLESASMVGNLSSDLALTSAQSAEAVETSEIRVQVWEALPLMLTGPGGTIGNASEESDTSLLDGEFSTESNATSLLLRDFDAGRYSIQIHPRIGFEDRLFFIDFETRVNGEMRTLRASVLKTDGVDEISFDLSDDGALSIVDQPKRPIDLSVSYSEDQSETILTWVAPADTTVTGYRIFSREEGSLNFQLDEELAGTLTRYTDNTPAVASGSSALAREYVIVAINANGKESFVSSIVSSRSLESPDDIALAPSDSQSIPQWVYSNPAVVSGINVPVSISIANGEYSIDDVSFTTEPGIVQSGQSVTVRVAESDFADPNVQATLSVGGRTFFFSTDEIEQVQRDTAWRATEIYIATMGYSPDNEGLQYWIGNIDDAGWTPTAVAQSFFDQPLVKEKYPDDLGYEELIEALYQNIFGRSADADGKAYWLEQLNAGLVRRNEMIITLIEGGWANPDAVDDMARFGNQVKVGLAFAAEQAVREIAYSRLSEEQQTRLRMLGAQILMVVTADNETRSTAIASIPDLLDSL